LYKGQNHKAPALLLDDYRIFNFKLILILETIFCNQLSGNQKQRNMSKRLLIIDNDTEVLNMMQEALVYEGFEVKTLERADHIFKVIDEYQPDLIMIDYILDGINGGEICHDIKVNPETGHIPVIIVTAYSKVILSLGSYRSDAFLAKPFGLDEMVKLVNKLLASITLQAC